MPGRDPSRRDIQATSVVRAMLDQAHHTSHFRAILGPDSAGVFPDLAGLDYLNLHAHRPVLVPDTNVLRGDVGRACRRGRTVLVNAANSGALLVLCPRHVAEEMFEKAEEFSAGLNVGVTDFLATWETAHLRVFRMVPDLPDAVLTDDELPRIEHLQSVDADDVPAARLATATGGFFLSEDNEALEAVYGTDVDRSAHHAWLQILKSAGDAHELANVLESGAFLSQIVAGTVRFVGQSLTDSIGASGLAGVATVLVAYAASDPTRRARIRRVAGAAGATVLETFVQYQAALDSLNRFGAPVPPPASLLTMDPEGRVLRDCLQAFCRCDRATHSAAEIHGRLRALKTPSGVAKIRHVLRTNDCFAQPYPGRFQLGWAWPQLVSAHS